MERFVKERGVGAELIVQRKLNALVRDRRLMMPIGYSEGTADVVTAFKDAMKDNTVYAVYREGRAYDYPEERGQHFTIDTLCLSTDDVPLKSDDSELYGVFASLSQAESYAKGM